LIRAPSQRNCGVREIGAWRAPPAQGKIFPTPLFFFVFELLYAIRQKVVH
jgi:hypothetical protein